MREEDGRIEPTLMAAATPDFLVSGVMKRSSNKRRRRSLPSPASSSSSHSGSTTTQQQQQQDEEADMARCLILLAQGPCAAVQQVEVEPPASNKRRSSYECKTCNKCFPSFQALGGHRTSHNNNAADSKKNKPRRPEPPAAEHAVTTTLSLRPAAAAAAHECSACGAAFASGQALGGHMRRHRPLTVSAAAPESVVTAEERSNVVNLELDLNLLPGPSTEQEVTSPAKGIMHHFKH